MSTTVSTELSAEDAWYKAEIEKMSAQIDREIESMKKEREDSSAIRELERKVQELAAAMGEMAYKIQRNKENEAHEREKLSLKIEREVLRHLLASKQ